MKNHLEISQNLPTISQSDTKISWSGIKRQKIYSEEKDKCKAWWKKGDHQKETILNKQISTIGCSIIYAFIDIKCWESRWQLRKSQMIGRKSMLNVSKIILTHVSNLLKHWEVWGYYKRNY